MLFHPLLVTPRRIRLSCNCSSKKNYKKTTLVRRPMRKRSSIFKEHAIHKLNDRHFDRSDSRSLRVAEWRNLLLYLDRSRHDAFAFLAIVPRKKRTTTLCGLKINST